MGLSQIKYIFPTKRFWITLAVVVAVFVIGYGSQIIYYGGIGIFALLIVISLYDIIKLWGIKMPISAIRRHEDRLSNGDDNPIELTVSSRYDMPVGLEIIDEVPYQFQLRDFSIKIGLNKREEKTLNYTIHPIERGEYRFGKTNIFISTKLGYIERKIIFDNDYNTKVYPSYIQLRKHMLVAATNRLDEHGQKRVRKIGRSLEFDQISKYFPGEDYRTINWKASARRGELMINRYIEEKSQPIYSVIDMGRSMRMPFENLTLADYAINSALVLSALSINKGDKSGLVTFSDTIGNNIEASNRRGQMPRILDTLYNANTFYRETGYHVVYKEINSLVKERSLLMLYTNFETTDVLNRNLPYLKAIAKRHLLVAVVFKNTEIHEAIGKDIQNPRQAAIKTIAEELEMQKTEIIATLNRSGIQTIYTTPKNLTTDTINRYLKIKAQNSL
jgi:uncharacterized protein (DUF58 family)